MQLGGFVLSRHEAVEAHLKPQGILRNSATLQKGRGKSGGKMRVTVIVLAGRPRDQSELLLAFSALLQQSLVGNGLLGQALSLQARGPCATALPF